MDSTIKPQTYHHGTIALETILEMDDGELRGMLTLGGEWLTPEQCRVTAQYFLGKGYTYLPTCNNVDSRGQCKGHPVEEMEQ